MNQNEEFEPDQHLTEEDAVIPDHRPRREEIVEAEIHEENMHRSVHFGATEEEDFEQKYAKYSTPDDVREERTGSVKKAFAVVAVVVLFVMVARWYVKATNEIAQDEIRHVSQAAKLPQDLNMTEDSVLWMTAKDSEIASLQRDLNMIKAGNMYAGTNTTAQQGKPVQSQASTQTQQQPQQLSMDQIIAAVRKEVQLSLRGNSGLKAPPPLPMTKGLPKSIQRIASNDGNSKTLSVDDFLTVPQNQQPPAPINVDAAQKMLPPSQQNIQQPIQIPSLQGPSAPIAIQPKAQIRITDVPSLKTNYVSIKETEAAKKDKKGFYLLTGLAKATLHTGFRAPTLAFGEKNQQPVYLSIDSDVISANDSTTNIQDCTVMGTSRGNLNSGRAEIRLDELTCEITYKNGKHAHITEKINGWVYGEDGMFGLKGRLVSSEGKILESAIPIALIQSLIGSMSQLGQTTQTISTVGTAGLIGETTITPAEQMQNGALKGLSKSMNTSLSEVVDYYVSILKELNPAIEILGGRNRLTILFKGGEELKEKDYEPLNIAQLREEKK